MKKLIILLLFVVVIGQNTVNAEFVNVTDRLNVRSSAQLNSNIIDTLPRNHYVAVQYKNDDWAYIKYYSKQKYKYGWVKKEYLTLDNPTVLYPVYMEQVNALIDTKHFSKALEIANKFVNDYPTNHYAFAIRGSVYNKLGDYNKAVVNYTNAIRLVQHDSHTKAVYYFCRALSYANLNMPQQALDDFNSISREELRHLGLNSIYMYHYIKGIQELDLGMYNLAIDDFSRAISINHSPFSYIYRAMVYSLDGQYKKSKNDYYTAIAICRNDSSYVCQHIMGLATTALNQLNQLGY